MGSAKSKNVANIVTNIITTETQNLLQESKNSASNSITVNISSDGDANVIGNKFNQKATINSEQLLTALSDQKAQNKIVTELKQKAESLVSGLNLGNSAESDNIINSFLNASLNVTSNISQTCHNTIGQSIVINVISRNGAVNLKENTFDQIAEIYSSCIADTKQIQDALQDVQQKVDQAAKAEADGLNLWAVALILFMVAVIIMSPFIGIAIGGARLVQVILQFLFPIIFILGGIFIALYFILQEDIIRGDGFSKGLDKSDACRATKKTQTPVTYPNPIEASDACLKSDKCQGLDWIPGEDGDQPITYFYGSIGNPSCPFQVDPKDNKNQIELEMPVMTISETPPVAGSGGTKLNDMYLNPSTGDYYIMTNNNEKWPSERVGNFYTDIDKTPDGSSFKAQLGGKCGPDWPIGFNIVYGTDYNKMFVYSVDKNKVCRSVTVTKADSSDESSYYISSVARPDVPGYKEYPWSGMRYTARNSTWLYLGISFVVVGIIGTVIMMAMNSKSNKEELVPPSVAKVLPNKKKTPSKSPVNVPSVNKSK